jgi:hypothetical protein
MLERTRLLGPELIHALERADEVLSAHDNNKGHKWETQTWREHAERAIKHLQLALDNAEDGTEIEAAHGCIRAVMALEKIVSSFVPRRLCKSHAIEDNLSTPKP